MRKKVHPRVRRFNETTALDWQPDLMYRREAWVYRRLYGYWATPAQLQALNQAVARYFGVPAPKLICRMHKSLVEQTAPTTGYFKVEDDGRHWIVVRGVPVSGTYRAFGVTNRCKQAEVRTRCKAGEYLVHTFLHEFAHYLAFLWWGDGAHDSRFASVTEIVHEWYSRRRKRETRRAVTYRID